MLALGNLILDSDYPLENDVSIPVEIMKYIIIKLMFY